MFSPSFICPWFLCCMFVFNLVFLAWTGKRNSADSSVGSDYIAWALAKPMKTPPANAPINKWKLLILKLPSSSPTSVLYHFFAFFVFFLSVDSAWSSLRSTNRSACLELKNKKKNTFVSRLNNFVFISISFYAFFLALVSISYSIIQFDEIFSLFSIISFFIAKRKEQKSRKWKQKSSVRLKDQLLWANFDEAMKVK